MFCYRLEVWKKEGIPEAEAALSMLEGDLGGKRMSDDSRNSKLGEYFDVFIQSKGELDLKELIEKYGAKGLSIKGLQDKSVLHCTKIRKINSLAEL